MWIALGIAAVLALLLLAPVKLTLTISRGEGKAVIRYLFLRFAFPKKDASKGDGQKKPKKKKKPKAAGKAAPKPPEEEPKKWDSGRVQDAIELAGAVLRAMGKAGQTFLRGLRIKTVMLQVLVVRGDACQTAAACGKLNAAAYTAAAFVQNFVKIKKLMLNIAPCFWCTQESVSFLGEASVRPIRFLMAGAVMAANSAGPLLSFLRKQKRDAQPKQAGASMDV